MPFREAHSVVASLVRLAVDSGRPLSELTPDELSAQSVLLLGPGGAPSEGEAPGADYYRVLSRDSWLESKVSVGGTALPRVREQIELARSVLTQPASG
jgi:argininosuccinate lyase